MTNKERAKLLRGLADDIENGTLLMGEVNETPKPQHPEPGTVVEWRSCVDHHWSFGIVSYDGWFMTLNGEYLLRDHNIEYRPVYIVTPPPSNVDTWQGRVWQVYEHHAGIMESVPTRYSPSHWGRHIATVTREDMKRMESVDG